MQGPRVAECIRTQLEALTPRLPHCVRAFPEFFKGDMGMTVIMAMPHRHISHIPTIPFLQGITKHRG
jgi:hypothetical protein